MIAVTISTLTFQTNALDQMEALQTALSKTQTELSTGKQIQSAADNPTGMAQVNQLNAELSASQQYVTNGNLATSNLQLEAQALSDATNLLQSARDLAVQANNAALSSSQRQDIATQLSQQLQQLVAIGNRTDGNGNYLFAGYASNTEPFAQNGGSVTYQGADETGQAQISGNQRISSGDTGSSVFMNIAAGNGTFTTAAAASNSGTASIGPGTVIDASAWVKDTYTIDFTSPTAYQVTNSGGTVVGSGTYDPTSGGTIAFKGVQVAISGSPAAGDQFTVAPAGTTSAFATLSGLATTLSSTTLSTGQLTTGINQALEQIDGAVNKLGDVQASVGARLNAVTAAQSTEQSNQTNYQTSISGIADTNYAAATTQLSTEELALQAAEESYASLSKLSLFNYVS